MLCSQNSQDVIWLIWKGMGRRVLILGRGLWFWEGAYGLSLPASLLKDSENTEVLTSNLTSDPTVLLCKKLLVHPTDYTRTKVADCLSVSARLFS